MFHVTLMDLLHGIYLVSIIGADYWYQDYYMIYDIQWTDSVGCQLLSILSLTSIIGSCFALNLLAFSCLMIVMFPLNSHFKNLKLPLICIVLGMTFSFTISLLFMTLHKANKIKLSPLCNLLHVPHDCQSGNYCFILFVAMIQILSSISLVVMNVTLVIMVRKSGPQSQTNIGESKKSLKRHTLVATGMQTCSLLLSGLIYLVTCIVEQNSRFLITWTVVVINSVVPLLNPLLFWWSLALKCCHQSKVSTTKDTYSTVNHCPMKGIDHQCHISIKGGNKLKKLKA